MPGPDFDQLASGIAAVLSQTRGSPAVRRVFDHEPSPSINYGLLPFATVFLGPINRPTVNQPRGEITNRYFTTTNWSVRIYLRLTDGQKAQAEYRSHARSLLDAFDTYRTLNAPPGNVPICQDSACSHIDHAVMGDQRKPVFVLIASVETFTIA